MSFDRFKGPPWLSEALIRTGRKLSDTQTAQAILSLGDVGLGRSDWMMALAGWLLCDKAHPSGACGVCQSCTLFKADTHPDLSILGSADFGGASAKIEVVREMISTMQKTPSVSRCRVALIMAADTLNTASSNALLKTLESPEGLCFFILASDAEDSILPTLKSRCQRVYLASEMNSALALDWLKSSLDVDQTVATHAMDISGGLPLKALKYIENESINSWMACLSQCPQADLKTWQSVFSGSSLIELLNLIQLLILDRIQSAQCASLSSWGVLYPIWQDYLLKPASIHALYEAEADARRLRKLMSTQVALNDSMLLMQIYSLWSKTSTE